MPKRPNVSAGLILFRRLNGELEIFLAHPGGPFWKNRDIGAWTIPKGAIDEGEEPIDAARREFEEETSIHPKGYFIPLGSIKQKSGKTVYAWAWEGDADPKKAKSNLMSVEWPRKSGQWLTFPEVDRCEWFEVEEAKQRIIPAQAELITRLQFMLKSSPLSLEKGAS